MEVSTGRKNSYRMVDSIVSPSLMMTSSVAINILASLGLIASKSSARVE